MLYITISVLIITALFIRMCNKCEVLNLECQSGTQKTQFALFNNSLLLNYS